MATMAAVAVLGVSAAANAQTFSNPTVITIPSGTGTSGPATPYPSTIAVTGMAAGPWDIDVTITGLTHTFPSDLDILLVGPSGNVMVMSDTGGSGNVTNINLTFSDGAPQMLNNQTDAAPLLSGTYGPPNVAQTDPMAAPAPVGPYGTSLNLLGLGVVNGTWNLFVVDDVGGDIGAINGGWSITFSAVPAPGALALLGLAGLAGARRRRRA